MKNLFLSLSLIIISNYSFAQAIYKQAVIQTKTNQLEVIIQPAGFNLYEEVQYRNPERPDILLSLNAEEVIQYSFDNREFISTNINDKDIQGYYFFEKTFQNNDITVFKTKVNNIDYCYFNIGLGLIKYTGEPKQKELLYRKTGTYNVCQVNTKKSTIHSSSKKFAEFNVNIGLNRVLISSEDYRPDKVHPISIGFGINLANSENSKNQFNADFILSSNLEDYNTSEIQLNYERKLSSNNNQNPYFSIGLSTTLLHDIQRNYDINLYSNRYENITHVFVGPVIKIGKGINPLFPNRSVAIIYSLKYGSIDEVNYKTQTIGIQYKF